MENIKVLIHKLNNVLSLFESSINRLKNADEKTLEKRWLFMKDIFDATGRDRLDREIESYKNTSNTIDEAFQTTFNSIFRHLSEANENYKTMFDLLDKPDGCAVENRDTVLTNGNRLVAVLKDVTKILEKVKIELQKKQNPAH